MDLAIEFQQLKDGQEKILKLIDGKQNQSSQTNVVFSKKDLAKMFKVTERTIDNWKDQGKLDFVQISSKTYFTPAHVDEFLKQNEVKSLSFTRRAKS